MFGKCKVCLEKDKRISDLQNQIGFLRRQLLPGSQNSLQFEATSILSGNDEITIFPSDPTDEQIAEYKKIKDEEVDILTGNY